MEDLRETCVRLHAQGQPWVKREEEFIGVVLWAVGITTLALLPTHHIQKASATINRHYRR